MTTIYTYSEARQKLAALLEKAIREGEVKIRRRDGTIFVLRPEQGSGSPLDIPGVDLGISTKEILSTIREVRQGKG